MLKSYPKISKMRTRNRNHSPFSQDQQSDYAYNSIGDYGTDGGSDVAPSYDFADDSVYATEMPEAAGEDMVALNQQLDDGPYGVVKKYQDDHVCNIQYDVSREVLPYVTSVI